MTKRKKQRRGPSAQRVRASHEAEAARRLRNSQIVAVIVSIVVVLSLLLSMASSS
jgi:hypothetical protein